MITNEAALRSIHLVFENYNQLDTADIYHRNVILSLLRISESIDITFGIDTTASTIQRFLKVLTVSDQSKSALENKTVHIHVNNITK